MEQFLETVSWSSVIHNASACSCLPEDGEKHRMERGEMEEKEGREKVHVSPQSGGEVSGRMMQKENVDRVFGPNIDSSV